MTSRRLTGGAVIVFVAAASAAVLLGAIADSLIASLSSPSSAYSSTQDGGDRLDDVYSPPDSYGGSSGYTYSLDSYPLVPEADAQDQFQGYPRVYCEQVPGDPSTFHFSQDPTKGLTPGSYYIQIVRIDGRDGLFGCLYGPTGN